MASGVKFYAFIENLAEKVRDKIIIWNSQKVIEVVEYSDEKK